MMGNVQEQIERLLAKRAQLDARLATARTTASRQERRDETRRKIIAGAMMFKMNGCDWRKVGEQLRSAKILDVRDYSLFGVVENDSGPTPNAEPQVAGSWRDAIRPTNENS